MLNDSKAGVTRRRMLAGGVIALCGRMAQPWLWAENRAQSMKQIPGAEANEARTSLHQEIEFKVAPPRIYEVLLSAKEFAAFTGMPAAIDPSVGGAFSTFGGMIVGRNVELVPEKRIVQAWRPASWEPGVYSVVRFELKMKGPGTAVVLDHTGFPKGDYDHLFSGWGERYWDPLHKYLA